MGILFGLVAALGWGTGDFIAGRVSRSLGVLQTMFYVQLCGMISIGVLLMLQPGAPAPTAEAWGLAAAIALGNFAGTLLLYRAFAIGTLSIVAPISSGFAIVTALLALAAGERPAALALAGATLLIGGVIVVTRASHGQEEEPRAENQEPSVVSRQLSVAESDQQPTASDMQHTIRNRFLNSQFSILNFQFPKGVLEALGVTICFGGALWALDFVTPALGILWPVLVTKAIETVGALLWLFGRGSAPVRLSRDTWPLVIGAGLCDNMAFVAFNTGLGSAYTSIVTALASLFSAVTVLLAWVMLRERLSPGQWVGVTVILVGVLLVSL
jgi:drug/metabolite transporter (DMT)-like permease